jgi:hypothetical protein
MRVAEKLLQSVPRNAALDSVNSERVSRVVNRRDGFRVRGEKQRRQQN